VYRQAKTHSQPPVSLLGQLYWREHFYLIAAVTPQYGTMHGNPMCRIIDWCDGARHEPASEQKRGGAGAFCDFARRCQG
jgi:cryptochrome